MILIFKAVVLPEVTAEDSVLVKVVKPEPEPMLYLN